MLTSRGAKGRSFDVSRLSRLRRTRACVGMATPDPLFRTRKLRVSDSPANAAEGEKVIFSMTRFGTTTWKRNWFDPAPPGLMTWTVQSAVAAADLPGRRRDLARCQHRHRALARRRRDRGRTHSQCGVRHGRSQTSGQTRLCILRGRELPCRGAPRRSLAPRTAREIGAVILPYT